MGIYRHDGYIRKEVYSIEFVENLLNKDTYPPGKNKKHKIEVGGELIRRYDSKYELFFTKGYNCTQCGAIGSYFALENYGGEQNGYSLNLYAIDKTGEEVLMAKSLTADGQQPLCLKCIHKRGSKSFANKQKRKYSMTEKKKHPLVLDISRTSKNRNTLFNGFSGYNLWIVGYCENKKHEGLIDINLAEEHKCVEKKCQLFKIYDIVYWDRARLNSRKHVNISNEIREYVYSILDSYQEIYVTSMSLESKGILITYISDGDCDLSKATENIRFKYKMPVLMRRVQTSVEIIEKLIRKRNNVK